MHLDRPARGERHECGEQLGLRDDAAAVGYLVREDVGEQVAAGAVGMGARLAQHHRGARRQIRIAVDLAVRMGQRHADLLAAVLEAEHVRDAGACHQIRGAVAPCVDDESRVRQFELG